MRFHHLAFKGGEEVGIGRGGGSEIKHAPKMIGFDDTKTTKAAQSNPGGLLLAHG